MIAVLLLLVNCREFEEVSDVSQNNQNISLELEKKLVINKTVAHSLSDSSKVSNKAEGDPPKKDDIKW